MLKRFARWVLSDDTRCPNCQDVASQPRFTGSPAAEIRLFPAVGGLIVELITLDPTSGGWPTGAAPCVQRSFITDADKAQLGERITALYVSGQLQKAK